MITTHTFDPDLLTYKQNLCPTLLNQHCLNLGPAFQFIYDHHTRRFVVVENEIFTVAGYPPDTMTREGYDFLLRRIPSPDLKLLPELFSKGVKYLNEHIPEEKRDHYTINLDYRLKHQNGRMRPVLHQWAKIISDRRGNIVYTLEKITDVYHRPPEVSPMLSVYGSDPEYSLVCGPQEQIVENESPFTQSELKVLELLNIGLTTQEIADRLHLSAYTVGTHRRNMMKKIDVHSTSKLLLVARRIGFI